MRYGKHFSSKATPQSEPIPGSTQVENSAGGFSWAVDDWVRLDRFLVLGSEGGTYYTSEKKLTKENAGAVLRCINQDGPRVVSRIVEISDAGRAPKNDPAIFALAMAAGLGTARTKQVALDALPKVCRIGTHLFHFAEAVQEFRGWGRGLRRAIGKWYLEKLPDYVAFQAIKYRQRDGWTHRDLLRLAHPKASSEEFQRVLHWIVKGTLATDQPSTKADAILAGFEELQAVATPEQAATIIYKYGLPREAVPTEMLNFPVVWEALASEFMPYTAMIRNLATMTRVGLLTPLGAHTKQICARIIDEKRLKGSRTHPVGILAALMTYSQGKGMRGQHTWTPVPEIIDALDRAFYLSFGNVTPTGKRMVLALDVSSSMDGGTVSGVPGLTPRVASAAMALVTAAVEKSSVMVAFTTRMVELKITARTRLDDAVAAMQALPFGGTDCSLPMKWALDLGVNADAFVILTDSETWAGSSHPVQALRTYRASRNIPAKFIVVGMVSNEFTIADPNDAGMMDCVGFDTATPDLISSFVRGDLLGKGGK